MDNLPAKQSAFTRIRNNILSAGLSNRFTRNIIANAIPNLFGYRLTQFVLHRDSEDVTGTMQLLSAMNSNAVKVNMAHILSDIGRVAFGVELYSVGAKNDQLINMILDAVKPDAIEVAIQGILKDSEILNYSITDETCKRITDSIDCRSKKPDEIRELINLLDSTPFDSPKEKLIYNFFENLTLEQRKEHFPQIVPILTHEGDVPDYSQFFEQIPSEDRLEIYQKIIEVNNSEEIEWRKSLNVVSKCFEMLSEEERLGVLSDTIEQIRSSTDNDKKLVFYTRVLGSIPAEEQEQYYKEALESWGNNIYQMANYVSILDKSLQEEIVFDILDKLRIVMKDRENYIGHFEALQLIKSFEPNVICDALTTILNGDIDLLETKFAVDLLNNDGVIEYIQENVQGQNIIKKEQLLTFQEKGYDVEKLALLFVNLESNNLLQTYIENTDGRSYSDTLKELSNLGIDIKFSDNKDTGKRSDKYDIVLKKKLDTYLQLFLSLSPEERNEHFEETVHALFEEMKISKDQRRIVDKTIEIFGLLDDEEKTKHFESLFKAFDNINDNNTKKSYFMDFFRHLDNKTQMELFKNCTSPSSENLKFAAEILKKCSVKELNVIFKGEITLDEETISKLMVIDESITLKTLLFDKSVDREKIMDLSSYDQIQNNVINIDSIIQKIYIKSQGKGKNEFNQLLSDTYNLFTYNNVPEFMKNFRIFQLGTFYNKQNENIISFQGKTNEERDSLILEDLFKISLDSNNESLRNFANIILEGKKITTKIQSNPEEKLKTLSEDELALLYQYRDTLFELHNLTKEIRNTGRPKLEKTDDIIKDFRTIIATYSDNETHNPNSKNVVFNPNKIMDELFEGFITTTIRPKAMIEYMDRRKAESDERHLRIEQQLRNGTMHLEVGDFIKGIGQFDDYIPSMLRDGVKGGEFNQEHSHSDLTPLDADFGYISKANLQKENATDYEIISTTISFGFGENYIVLKQYADRLQDRSGESFDQGTFTGSPDYYSKRNGEEQTYSDRYIRTGIPVTDIDYIVSKDWNPKNGYEMAMAGIYIPVINPKGELVFTSEQYNRIREEMRGLSHYGADNIIVSKDATNMDVLYTVYRGLSKKTTEEIDSEIETVRGLVDGKTDVITEQKKNATTRFIRTFFKTKGIRVTDDLSQNLASQSVELIDTGSTGRGTNVPGDGDFDFMLRHNLPSETIAELVEAVKTLQTSESQFISVSDGVRTKNVTLPTGEVVDIDVTTAKKSLALSYSSDMCVRDRLENIRENNPESYNYVKANIIMAKKILKAVGIYKKLGSDGATEHGGFGGIGVENWILQNGGSFKTAIDTFLEVADKSESYDEFKKKYPIFDFGFNHREGKIRHDRFSAFFANNPNNPGAGFEYVKSTLAEIQKTMELERQKQAEQQEQSSLIRSISPEGFEEAGSKRSVLRNKFSYSMVRGMVSKFMASPESDRVQTALEEV